MILKIIFLFLMVACISSCKLLKVEGVQSEIGKCDINRETIKGVKLKLNTEAINYITKRDKIYLFGSEKNEYFIKIIEFESSKYLQVLSSHDDFSNCNDKSACAQADLYFERLMNISKQFLTGLGCSLSSNNIRITDFEKNRQGFKLYSDNFENDILYY